MKLRKFKAFTLIELLVVISIIGILATIVTISIGNAVAKSRDGKRKEDLATISKAIVLYGVDKRQFPGFDCSSNNNGGLNTYCNAAWQKIQGGSTYGPSGVNGTTIFSTALLPYLANLPTDPKNAQTIINSTKYNLFYQYYSGLDSSSGKPYYFLKDEMETGGGNYGNNQCFGFLGGAVNWSMTDSGKTGATDPVGNTEPTMGGNECQS